MKKGTLPAMIVAAAMAVASGSARAAGDADAGESVFKKRCQACHTVDEGKNRVGPSLFGVVGRQAGTAAKYKYSASYTAAGEKGLTWDREKIVKYLEDPRGYMRAVTGDQKARTKMTFKLKDAGQRADVAAYLATVK